MGKTETRERILEAGARLVHQKGFQATGIQEILSIAGVPKGSFYFYFKSKDDFGLSLIDRFDGHLEAVAKRHLDNLRQRPLRRLKGLFDEFAELFEGEDAKLGCPIGNLASEMGDVDELFRQRLAAVWQSMTGAVQQFLQAAQEAGDLPTGLDTRKTAEFVLSSWQGALVAMKVEGSTRPLEVFDELIFTLLGALNGQHR